MKLYEVAVAAPLADSLTYSQPAGSVDELPVGIRVLVPLGVVGALMVMGLTLCGGCAPVDNGVLETLAT
jgi:primosomal protein N'